MPKKVLIVDDSFVMRTIIREIISVDNDIDIVGEAGNGLAALEMVKQTRPDVILLDIEMPEMDGIECLKRLRLSSPAKVVVVSSVTQAGSPQALEARRLGAFDVIAKPGGAMSLDLQSKKGHDILRAVRAAAGLMVDNT